MKRAGRNIGPAPRDGGNRAGAFERQQRPPSILARPEEQAIRRLRRQRAVERVSLLPAAGALALGLPWPLLGSRGRAPGVGGFASSAGMRSSLDGHRNRLERIPRGTRSPPRSRRRSR
jgi:hypothetical protein